MAKKNDNSSLWLLALLGAGAYYVYTQQQKDKATQALPAGTMQDVTVTEMAPREFVLQNNNEGGGANIDISTMPEHLR